MLQVAVTAEAEEAEAGEDKVSNEDKDQVDMGHSLNEEAVRKGNMDNMVVLGAVAAQEVVVAAVGRPVWDHL